MDPEWELPAGFPVPGPVPSRLLLQLVGLFGLTVVAATERIGVTLLLFFTLRDDRWHVELSPMLVYGDEGEISAGDVAGRGGHVVLDIDLHADLHRGRKGAIDGRLQDQQVTNVDRRKEIDVVHGGGNDVTARVTVRGHGGGDVDEVHEASAKQIAERIGIVGEDDLRHLRL